MSQSLIEELGKLKASYQAQAEKIRMEGNKHSDAGLALSAARAFGQVVAYEGVVISLNEIMESHGETTPAPAVSISPKDLFYGLAMHALVMRGDTRSLYAIAESARAHADAMTRELL
jgi:hypothetical protein